jgi:serine/threonine protein kinase
MSRRRSKPLQLLDVLRKNKKLETIITTVAPKIGADRETTNNLLNALATLDKEFSEANWEVVEKIINRITLVEINWEPVKKLGKEYYAKLFIKEDSRIAQATSQVLLDCRWQGQDCVVKMMDDRVSFVDLFIESLINIFISGIAAENKYISSPDIITTGIAKDLEVQTNTVLASGSLKKVNTVSKQYEPDRYILIQEKIDGVEFKKIKTEATLRKALITLCKGMKQLQDNYNFAHRDFHGGNVMYDENKNLAYIIDFGYSCFSIPDTNGSIQALEGGYGYDQLDPDYKSHIPCINKSHDICVLILSLAIKYDILWLDALAEEITNRYYNIYPKFDRSTGWYSMDYQVKQSYGYKYNWDGRIMHFWYLYEMFEIDIGMGPDVIWGILEGTTSLKTNRSAKTQFETLKF